MKKITTKKPFLIFIVVFGLLFFLSAIGALRPLQNLLSRISVPTSSRLFRWGNNFNQRYSAGQAVVDYPARAASLAEEVARLTVANSVCREIQDENNKLRGLLNFSPNGQSKLITAGVIAKEISSEAGDGGQDIVISKGARDGLRLGLAVVNESGVVVGKISDLKDATAKVCLTTSAECRLAASIQNQDKTQGITDGDLGLTIRMDYIPQSEKIAPGDTVISSGLGGNIPRGLLIGRVASVRNESNEVWQSATIEPLVNLNDLTIVAVVIP